MNAADFYAEKADIAFAKYSDICTTEGEYSEQAQIAYRQYLGAMLEYLSAAALDNEVAA
jgi:hypothetical protein